MLFQNSQEQDNPTSANTLRWGLNIFMLTAVAGTALLLAYHSLSDLDIWLHWRAGRDILSGTFPRTNTYSFSATSRTWVDHEWLFQVLLALVGKTASLGGHSISNLAAGWNILRVLLVLGLVLILGRPLYQKSNVGIGAVSPQSGLALSMLLGLTLLWPRMTMRPELVSYILLALAVPLVEKCWFDQTTWRVGWHPELRCHTPASKLFLITLFWAQLHGFAVLVPLLILLTGLLGSLPKRLSGSAATLNLRSGMVALVWSLLALGMTPSGWRGWIYPLTVMSQFTGHGPDLQHTISELVPLAQAPNSLAWTLLLYKVCLGWGLLRIALAWPRVNLLRSVLFVVTAWAAWSSQRNLGFMAVALILLHRGEWGPPASWQVQWLERKPGLALKMWLPPVVTLGVVLLWWPLILHNAFYLHEGVGRRSGGGLTPAQYPQKAVVFLDENAPTRVFANLDAAAFLIGNTDNLLFIDGRTEAYPTATWDLYSRVKKGGPEALRVLDKFTVSNVCLALGSGAGDNLAQALMSSSHWVVSAAGPGGILWSREENKVKDGKILAAAMTATERLAETSHSRTRKADLYLAASRLANLAERLDRARAFLRQGLAASPRHPLLLHNAGNLEMARGNYGKAAKYFALALATNPRLAGSALNAGVCALQQNNPQGAVGWFLKSVAINPRDFQAWANLGTARVKSGDRPGAIAAFWQAVKLRPGDERLRRRLQELRAH